MAQINYYKKNFAYVLFLVWPFLAFLSAFFHYKKPWTKNIVWLFIIYFGFTFVISGEGFDANRYREWFLLMAKQDISFDNLVSLLYMPGTRYVDIAQPIVTFLLSCLTDDSRILFAVFGLILGYFYSRNIWYLLEHAGFNIHIYTLPLIITFALLIGFWQINGFRFWTAAHIYLFGVLPYLIEEDRKKLWVAGLSVFFHFSFLLPVAVFFTYALVGKRIHFFFCFFILSFFVYKIDFHIIRNISLYLPEVFQERSNMYLNYKYAANIAMDNATRNWYARYYMDILQMVLTALVVFTYFNIIFLKTKKIWLIPLFSFSMFFSGIFNVLGNIPSVDRFITLGDMFLVCFLFFYFQYDNKVFRNKIILTIVLPFLLIFCVVSIRNSFDYMSLFTVFGNPVAALFGPGKMSLMDIIKM